FSNQLQMGTENAERAVDLFEKLRTAHPERHQYGRLLGRSYDLLAISRVRNGQYHSGARLFKEAIEVLQETVQQDPKDTEARRFLALTWNNLSGAQGATSDWTGQEEGLQHAIALFQDLANANPSNPRFRNDLGRSLSGLGE